MLAPDLRSRSGTSIQTTSGSLRYLYPGTNSYPHHCLTLDLKSGASIQTTSGSLTDLYPWTWCGYELVHGYRILSVSNPLVEIITPDFSSSVKQCCGYELIHRYRSVSDPTIRSKRTNSSLKYTTPKTKDWATRTPQIKLEENSGLEKGLAGNMFLFHYWSQSCYYCYKLDD
jgi:hypothetical protein